MRYLDGGATASDRNARRLWDKQFDAMFRIDFAVRRRCLVCTDQNLSTETGDGLVCLGPDL
jgi:hypothetical protein